MCIRDRDTSTREIRLLQPNYQWPSANFEGNSDELTFIYYDGTDVIGPDQIIPGLETREESYIRRE